MATEKLSVAVNIQTGNFMVALGGKGLFTNFPCAMGVRFTIYNLHCNEIEIFTISKFLLSLSETELTEEIEESLNSDHRELRKLLSKVR